MRTWVRFSWRLVDADPALVEQDADVGDHDVGVFPALEALIMRDVMVGVQGAIEIPVLGIAGAVAAGFQLLDFLDGEEIFDIAHACHASSP